MSDKSSSNGRLRKANVRIISICLISGPLCVFRPGASFFRTADLLDSIGGNRSRILVRAAGFHPDLHSR